MGDIELQIFSDRLKELRASLGLTQVQFVDGLGITASALSAYEKNLKNPSISVAKRIAEKYHVSIDWLCGLSDKKNCEDNIETYGDAIRLLLKLDENIDIAVSTGSPDVPDFGCVPYAEISFGNFRMQEFLREWEKMKELHDHCTIDDEVYSLWIEKTLKKYDKYQARGDGWPTAQNLAISGATEENQRHDDVIMDDENY